MSVNTRPAIAHREAAFALAWPSANPEVSRTRADRIPEAIVTALREVIPMKPGLKKSLNHTATAGPGYATFANGITVIQAPSAMPTLREVDMTGINDLGVVRLVDGVFAVLDAILLERREVV